jgi:hypothetical protein
MKKEKIILIISITFFHITSRGQTPDKSQTIDGTFMQKSILSCQNTIIFHSNKLYNKTLTVLSRDTITFKNQTGHWFFRNDTLFLVENESNEKFIYEYAKEKYLISRTGTECIYKRQKQ